MIEFCAEYPLIQLPIKHYAGFAYDGCCTYFSSEDKQIAICDENNIQIKAIQTVRFYHTLCYDPGCDCFWAAAQASPGILYRLSRDMAETETLRLENYQDAIQGLSYVRHNDSFMFFNEGEIYLTSRTGVTQKIGNDEQRKGYTLKLCAVDQDFLRLSAKQNHNYISFFSDQQLWNKEILPRDTQARDMVVYPDKNDVGISCIRIFAIRYGRKPCLFDYKIDTRPQCAPNEPPCTNDSLVDSSESNIESNDTNPCCPQQCCTKPCDPPPPCCPPPCNDCCPVPCPPVNCCTYDCCENYAKVLESIALVEASIAHILNAEGEKLQKVIQDDVSVSKLLQVNASVQKTIIHSTHLEHTLYDKLEALLQIDCKNCPTPCPKPCPPPCPKHCKPSKCNEETFACKRNDDETDEAQENCDSSCDSLMEEK